MKERRSIVVLLLILSVFLTGCQQKDLKEEVSESNHSEVLYEPVHQEAVKKEPAGEKVEAGVYEITSYLHIEGYAVNGMYLLDNDRILVALADDEYRLRTQIYDVYTGKLLEEKDWDYWYSTFVPFYAADGSRGYYAINSDNKIAIVYWKEEWKSVAIPEDVINISFYGEGQMVGMAGNVLYREETGIRLPEGYGYYDFVKVEPDGTVLLQAYNDKTQHYLYYLVNEKGQIRKADIGSDWIQLYNEWYVKEGTEAYTLYNEKNSRSEIHFVMDEKDEVLWDAAGNTLLTLTVDNEVRMYDIYTGCLRHRYAAGRNLYIGSLSQDGTKAIVGYQGDVFYYLDIEKGIEVEKKSIWPGWVDPDNDVCAMEEMMEAKYPVEIYVGKDAIYPFQDFAVRELNDREVILMALEEVDKVLGAFPEGFLEELLSGDISKMRIYITGEIIGEPAKGATSQPIAFAYPDYELGTQFIVLDGREPDAIVQNMAHELMHAMDICITEKAAYGYANFWQWDSYQPSDFWYNFSYQDINGEDYSEIEYTIEDTVNETYFVDAYSKTFATEDRARVFEYLFMHGVEGDVWEEISESPLEKKAEYLCEVIRSAFVCVNEETIWEKALP